MTDLRAKGAINKAKGQAQEGLGKLTGDRHEEAKGKVKQIQGSAQQGLGNLQNAIRRPPSR
jgi:uncharacterized protein YjbJ (UPF0337 family)